MCKVKYKLCSSDICNTFKELSSRYSLRQPAFSTNRYSSVACGRYSLRYLEPKLWGELSLDDRSTKTLNVYKMSIHGRSKGVNRSRLQGLRLLLNMTF